LIDAYKDKAKKDREEMEKDGKKLKVKDTASTDAFEDSNASATSAPKMKTVASASVPEVNDATFFFSFFLEQNSSD